MVGDKTLHHGPTRRISASMNQQIYVRVDAETVLRKRADNGNLDAAASRVSENSRYAGLRSLLAIVSSSADQCVDLVHP
jgi:hypothetical protein